MVGGMMERIWINKVRKKGIIMEKKENKKIMKEKRKLRRQSKQTSEQPTNDN